MKWKQAQTGYPWIDAAMLQLQQTGFMHHLARHAVACFLTRGDLWVDWQLGRDVFDELLVDCDPPLNSGNWQWLSCSAYFYQYFRVYSPVSFPKKYDKSGEFVRYFLPALRKVPDKFIYEPWQMPLEMQRRVGCVIGKDYPAPIVNHKEASSANIQRLKIAYDEHKRKRAAGTESSASRKKNKR